MCNSQNGQWTEWSEWTKWTQIQNKIMRKNEWSMVRMVRMDKVDTNSK